MSTLAPIPLTPQGPDVVGAGNGQPFTGVRRLHVAGQRELVTGDEETGVIVLAGTFDLVGGTTAWPSRGARSSPFAGRPVAVFLPPRTPFAAQHGNGEILLIAARQPPAAPVSGRAALQQSPLLPLAGSGKSFDPGSGEWRPAETFPSAPESLPPRRIAQVRLQGATVERVFPHDYKAATLTLDEIVVAPGATFAARELALPERATACLLYLRTDGSGTLRFAGHQAAFAGEAAFLLAGNAATLQLTAAAQPVYAVLAHGGK